MDCIDTPIVEDVDWLGSFIVPDLNNRATRSKLIIAIRVIKIAKWLFRVESCLWKIIPEGESFCHCKFVLLFFNMIKRP